MEEAGVKIIYSLPNIKVHSKIAVIRKKYDDETVTYAILSTGNFNESTARFYTDHVLITTDEAITKELTVLFKLLQKDDKIKGKPKFDTLLVSQYNMNDRFESLIEEEIRKARLKEDAQIRIKVNNLEDPYMIELLYKASSAGVKVHLIVRGICCLVPGVKDLSENIVIKRLIDRYLEHSRLFIFGAGGNAEVIMGSADWMVRNLHHRIEVCVSIKNPGCKKELLDYFKIQWKDNDKAVVLSQQPQEQNFLLNREEKINAQNSIYNYLKEKV